MKRHKPQRGISLLELMLSLAIIAILLVMATRYYQITRQSQQVDEAVEMITAVYTAGNSWLESHTGFADNMITEFIKDGSLPADFANPNVNPWGGKLEAAPYLTTLTTLTVTMENVPSTACQNLAAKVSQKMPGSVSFCLPTKYSQTTFVARFNLGP